MRRLLVLAMLVALGAAISFASSASAHVHGITPLGTLATQCGVTDITKTGANAAQGAPIQGLIPRDVGNAPLTVGDGGNSAPVGCATHGP